MMNLRHMEVFHAIMRTGSVTAAAQLLNVSQPAVSAALKHCEARLRIKLFTRVRGRLHPTPEARAIYPDVAAIFGRVDVIGRQMQDLAGGRLGTLTIAGAFPIANGYLAKAVATFVQERPRVRITLQSLTTPQVVDRVLSREVELGVAYEPAVNPEIEAELLVQSGVACVLREDHPLAAKAVIEARELAGHSVITLHPQALLRSYIDRVLGDAGVAPEVTVQVSVSLTGMMLAYHGAGIALVEELLLASMPLPGLVARPLRPRVALKTLLLRAKSVPPSAALDAFVDHLKETVREIAADGGRKP
jgi:DNA-binding transcriptional LysR family regulator